jgi:hypothetical protein
VSRARTRQIEQMKFNGLTTREFAAATSQSEQQVRDLIAARWFEWTDDLPECLDVASPGAKIRRYKILPSAVKRYLNERAVCAPRGKAA